MDDTVAAMAVLARILHAQVNSRRGERARQSEDVRVRSDNLLLRVLQSLLKGRAGLESHAAGDARLTGADDVDGAGVHLCDVTAGHHGEAVERVERDRKSTRLNSSHKHRSRMPSSA